MFSKWPQRLYKGLLSSICFLIFQWISYLTWVHSDGHTEWSIKTVHYLLILSKHDWGVPGILNLHQESWGQVSQVELAAELDLTSLDSKGEVGYGTRLIGRDVQSLSLLSAVSPTEKREMATFMCGSSCSLFDLILPVLLAYTHSPHKNLPVFKLSCLTSKLHSDTLFNAHSICF